VLIPEGEQLRPTFWHDLIEDPGPLTPLDEAGLRTLAKLLAVLDQQAG